MFASRCMTRHACVKALSNTTSQSPLDARLRTWTALKLLRSGWVWYGWRRISLLLTNASNNVLVAFHNSRATHATRVRAFQLVACEHHRKTLTSEGWCDDEIVSGGRCRNGANGLRIERCHPSRKPSQVGASCDRERMEIWAL